MFRKSHFNIYKSSQYPPFFHIIQSVHSPLLGNKNLDESPYSSIVTLGLWRERFTESMTDSASQGISICSVYSAQLYDPKELMKRIQLMKEDYLNKSLKSSDYHREATETLVERRRVSRTIHPLHGKVKPLSYFYPELHGGEDVQDRLVGALSSCSKLYFTTLPDSDELRADDALLLGRLLSFPSKESYSLAAALIQGVVYAKQRYL